MDIYVTQQLEETASYVDTLLTALSIGVAVSVPLLLFYLGNRHEKKKELRSSIKDGENALLYFTSLVKRIVEHAELQINNYNEYADDLHKDPYTNHQLKSQLIDDINRVTVGFNHERLFLAYLNKFGDTETNILTFQNIFNSVDLLRAIFSVNEDQYNRFSIQEDHRLMECVELTAELEDLCNSKLGEIKFQNAFWKRDAFNVEFDTTFTNYKKISNEYTGLGFFFDNLLKPLFVVTEKYKLTHHNASELHNQCKKITEKYVYIMGHAHNKADEIRIQALKIEAVLKDLKISTSILLMLT